jgi:hypothetical protein|nr:hypothetical protein [Prevotella sp.]
MLSTTDFEKLFFLYKTEGKSMSIRTFYVNKGINSKMIPVQLVID